VLADYGMGVRRSLLSVLPAIASDLEAIEIAFTKRISGRSPEQTGNGSCLIDRQQVKFIEKTPVITGCLAILDFSGAI